MSDDLEMMKRLKSYPRPRLVRMASAYNKQVKIPDVHRKKKDELIAHLMKIDRKQLIKLINMEESPTVKKSAPKAKPAKKINTELLKEAIKLQDQAIKTNDPQKKMKLIVESEKLLKKAKK